MGKKILAFGAVIVVAVAILAAAGDNLGSDAFAITGFAVADDQAKVRFGQVRYAIVGVLY